MHRENLDTDNEYAVGLNDVNIGGMPLAQDPCYIQLNQADHYNLPFETLKEIREKVDSSMK